MRYSQKYRSINIKKIDVAARTYLTSLPQNYEIKIKENSLLSNSGVLYIKTNDRKKIFFNYKVDAHIDVYKAKYEIKKGEELSVINTKKDSIILNKLRSIPIDNIHSEMLQAKRKIKANAILTHNDTTGLYLVKRDSSISVTLTNSNIAISFTAKANSNGRYGETISATNSNGKKIKVLVTGRNTAEIR